MLLTDELFERGINQKEICSVIDDNYVLLHKTMPCSDEELTEYINNMKKAKKNGIDLSCITDYKLQSGATHTFGKIAYTKGVFIEERAKGITHDGNTDTYLRPNKEYNYEEVARKYLYDLTSYIEKLEYFALGTQEMYDKFVSDYVNFSKYNIVIDPKPTNFFFDKDIGFTIIDPIPKHNGYKDDIEYFPSYIAGAVFGYGCPYVSAEKSRRFITMDLLIRLNNATMNIVNKLTTALRKNNLNEEDIQKGIQRFTGRIGYNTEVIDINDLSDCIKYLHTNEQEKSL